MIDVAALPDGLRSPQAATRSSSRYDAGDVEVASSGRPMRDAVAELERRMIVSALERAKGNRSEAARQLGIGRPQLYAKMEEYGVTTRDKD